MSNEGLNPKNDTDRGAETDSDILVADDGGEIVTDGGKDVGPEDLTRFKIDLLATIASIGPSKGLAIKAELEDYLDTDINHGRLYPNLDDLVERQLVTKGTIDRRTNEYALTDAGRTVLAARMSWIEDRVSLEESTETAVPDGGNDGAE